MNFNLMPPNMGKTYGEAGYSHRDPRDPEPWSKGCCMIDPTQEKRIPA